jgi:hypothetical protein
LFAKVIAFRYNVLRSFEGVRRSPPRGSRRNFDTPRGLLTTIMSASDLYSGLVVTSVAGANCTRRKSLAPGVLRVGPELVTLVLFHLSCYLTSRAFSSPLDGRPRTGKGAAVLAERITTLVPYLLASFLLMSHSFVFVCRKDKKGVRASV